MTGNRRTPPAKLPMPTVDEQIMAIWRSGGNGGDPPEHQRRVIDKSLFTVEYDKRDRLWRASYEGNSQSNGDKLIAIDWLTQRNWGCGPECQRCILEQIAGQVAFDGEFGAHLGSLASETTVELFGTSGLVPPMEDPIANFGHVKPWFAGPEPLVRDKTATDDSDVVDISIDDELGYEPGSQPPKGGVFER